MTTTAVFAEMLVAGIEALVWIALLALAIVQPLTSEIHRLAPMKHFPALITTIVLALSYGLGIVVDRCADSLFEMIIKKGDHKAAVLRLQVLARGDKVTDFLEYIRTRIRVARATTLNLALTTAVMPFFLIRDTRLSSCCQIGVIELVLASLTVIAAFAANRIAETYDNRLRQAAAIL